MKKDRFNNRTLVIVLMAVSILAIGGCMGIFGYSNTEKKEIVLRLLQEKYGEEFEGIKYIPEQWGQPYDIYYLYPKSGTEDNFFQVYGFKAGLGGYRITDNYFGVLIHDEYEAFVRTLLDQEFSEYKLKIRIKNDSTMKGYYKRDTTLDEIYDLGIKNEGDKQPLVLFTPEITVCLKESSVAGQDVKEEVMRFMQGMAEKKLKSSLELLIMKDDPYDSMPNDVSGTLEKKDIPIWYSIRIENDLQLNKLVENK